MAIAKVRDVESLNKKLLQAYFKTILDWIRLDRNRVIFLVGDIGSGKSTTALFYKYTLDSMMVGHPLKKNEFCWDDITFTARDFLQRVKEAPGHVILFDEAGVGAHARKWYDAANIAISQAAQVFRYKRNVILATVPRLKMVDKHLREVAHEIHVVSGKIIKDKFNMVYPRYVNYNAREDKTYLVMPQYAIHYEGRVRTFKVRSLLIPLPPKWLVEEYKKMQEEFKEQILEETLKTLEMIENEGETEAKVSPKKIIKDILNILEDQPELIAQLVTKDYRKGRVKFSPKKIRTWPYLEGVDTETSKIIAGKLNLLVFKDPYGALEYEYTEAYSDGSIYYWIKEAKEGLKDAI